MHCAHLLFRSLHALAPSLCPDLRFQTDTHTHPHLQCGRGYSTLISAPPLPIRHTVSIVIRRTVFNHVPCGALRPAPSSRWSGAHRAVASALPRDVPRIHVRPQIRFFIPPFGSSLLHMSALLVLARIRHRCTTRHPIPTSLACPYLQSRHCNKAAEFYFRHNPTAPDKVLADRPGCSDSVHIARYPCGTRCTRESSADLQVDLPKITQVVLALDATLRLQRGSRSPLQKVSSTVKSKIAFASKSLETGTPESHLSSTPFPPQPPALVMVIRRRTASVSSCRYRLGRCRLRGRHRPHISWAPRTRIRLQRKPGSLFAINAQSQRITTLSPCLV